VANQQQPGDSAAAGTAPLSPKGAARRRFTQAGAAASGVLLTLHSHPAMATGSACRSASGFHSGGVRSRSTEVATCIGRTPGYWKNHPDEWPKIGCDKTKLYCAIFLYSGRINVGYSQKKQLEILTPQGFDGSGIGRHIMAAYLNNLSGKSPYPTLDQLNKIWTEWRDYGYYTVTAGVKWDADKIVTYLKSTMPL